MSDEAAKAMLRRVANVAARAFGTVHDLRLAEQGWTEGVAEYLRVAGLEGDPAALLIAERSRSANLEAEVAARDQALAEKSAEADELRLTLAGEMQKRGA